MGNQTIANGNDAVSRFYRATTWIEGAAEQQIHDITALPGFERMAVFPDIHPGKFGPVGIAADFADVIHPALIGTDIGCGVAMATTDAEVRRLRLDKTVERLSEALSKWDDTELAFKYAAGTIGGGNHFCELTQIREVFSDDHGLAVGKVHILVHSGSRGLGAEVFDSYREDHGIRALHGSDIDRYLARHDEAMTFARYNREAVIRKAAGALKAGYEVVSDVPHNHVELNGGLFRHRKGASSADCGRCVVLGSRGALSYLVEPLPDAPATALASIAHGAGRKFDRTGAWARFGGKGVLERESRNPFGGYVVCENKKLAAEEAAGAYKPIGPVIADIAGFGLARVIASLQPLITWKTAGGRR